MLTLVNWVMVLIDIVRGTSRGPGAGKLIGVSTRKFYRRIQKNMYTCGALCVWMVVNHFEQDHDLSLAETCRQVKTTTEGTDDRRIARYFQRQKYHAFVEENLTMRKVRSALRRGDLIIACADEGMHYLVIHGIDDKYIYIADPLPYVPERRVLIEEFRERFDFYGVLISQPA